MAFGARWDRVAGCGARVLEVNVVRLATRPVPHRETNRKGGPDGASAQATRSSAQYESAAQQFRPQRDVQYERENAFID